LPSSANIAGGGEGEGGSRAPWLAGAHDAKHRAKPAAHRNDIPSRPHRGSTPVKRA
jgi:hypothetical protein